MRRIMKRKPVTDTAATLRRMLDDESQRLASALLRVHQAEAAAATERRTFEAFRKAVDAECESLRRQCRAAQDAEHKRHVRTCEQFGMLWQIAEYRKRVANDDTLLEALRVVTKGS